MRKIPIAVLLASIAVQPLAAQPHSDAAFNPAISLTLMGQYANYHQLDHLELPGFQLGGEAGLPDPGFSLDHTELTLSANIDPYFFGQVTAALANHDGETELELEEAFLETSALPAGFSLTFGRFLSGIGYLNSHHNHTWDFVDAPLPVQAFLGAGYFDDGLRLSWLAPTVLFFEVGAEAFRGGSFPASSDDDDIGAHTLFAQFGGDIGFDHSWQFGLSRLWADPVERTGGHGHDPENQDSVAFSGSSDLTIVDAVWKWAPGGNLQARHLTLQTEYFQRSEAGALTTADNSASARYHGTQRGLYTQAVYRFMPRWRTGLRYDRLWSDNRSNDPGLLARAELADADSAAQRYSVMLDFSPSEFSRLRLQFTRSDIDDETGNAVFLQYIMSLGAHGAHRF